MEQVIEICCTVTTSDFGFLFNQAGLLVLLQIVAQCGICASFFC